MKHTLAIPSKITPKPTQNEVIEAMTRIRVEQLTKENADTAAKRQALQKQIQSAIMAHVVENISRLPFESYDLGYFSAERKKDPVYSVDVRVGIPTLPKALEAMLVEFHKIPKYGVSIDEKQIKRDIREGMLGIMGADARVSALINAPETRKAMEAMLKEIGE